MIDKKEVLQLMKQFRLRDKEAESLYVLLRTAANVYQPKGNVLAISIGPGSDSLEGSIIRGLHESIGLDPVFVSVGNCDLEARMGSFDMYNQSDFDFEERNEFSGDAASRVPWENILVSYNNRKKRKTRPKQGFDFVLLNRPSLDKMRSPEQIYSLAVEFLESGGVIATVIDDLKDYRTLTGIYNKNKMQKNVISYEKKINTGSGNEKNPKLMYCVLLVR